MASKQLFSKTKTKTKTQIAPPADTVNEAGGKAYSRTSKEALAQLVMTGFLGDTFYVNAESQLENILKLAKEVEPEFLAKLAVEARENGYMKDTPALLCAVLTTHGAKGRKLLTQIFNRAIDNGKMLRNFVQIIRSGQVGRKSLGTFPKKLVRDWMETATDERLFKNSIGNDPSMADVIKMVHPKPKNKSRESLYAYLIGKDKGYRYLPAIVKEYESFKKSNGLEEMPEVPMEMLTSLQLTDAGWKELAKRMTWSQLRQNLNTLLRHKVFESQELTLRVANRLRDPELIKKAKVFPYQLYTTFLHMDPSMPREINDAVQDALEIALENIPEFKGKKVLVVLDVSGSMNSPVTGNRAGVTTKMRYVDVGSLFSAAMMRKGAEVWCVDTSLHFPKLNHRDSVATVAEKLSKFGGGGTNLSLPLTEINRQGKKVDLIVYFSDNESWVDRSAAYYSWSYQRSTAPTGKMAEFDKIKKANPAVRMVCVDMTPNTTKGESNNKDILNVGGFSDRVFGVIGDFLEGRNGADFWVKAIEKVNLD